MARADARALLAALPAQQADVVDALLGLASAADAVVYAVGGPVRDLLLGRPVRDLDLLVEPQHAAAIERIVRRLARDRFHR